MTIKNTLPVFSVLLFILLAGCTTPHNPIPNPLENNLTGNWHIIEIGMDNQIKQTYNINIIHTGSIIKFFDGTTELGYGIVVNNETISVTTNNATRWHTFGILLISIVNQTTMRAVPETTALKWINFEKHI